MSSSVHNSSKGVSNYHVFLSFRGYDTRSTFVSHLYHYLINAGIDVFKDDDELSFGGKIAEELPLAIENSRIYIPIFSETYASSKWCLLELAKMMEASSEGKKTVIPIFYRVTVDDIKLKTDLYKKELEAHRTEQTKETVDEWEKALKWVTKLRGWNVDGSKGDAEFCGEIVKQVSSELKIRHKLVPEPLFGQDYQKQRLIELLEKECLDKVVVIGIHGMGGIGKTTIAKVVYNEVYAGFDHCVFLSNVRQTLSENKSKGCLDMQKTLLSNVGHGSGNIDDSDDAITAIADRCKGKRVLIVLDDVNKEKQIHNILGKSTSFGGGSRIIITTRDARTLPMSKWPNVKSYEMEELKMEDALKLFNWHAFGELNSPAKYTTLCDTVVPRLTGCVPLCLEVIGSLLRKKDQTKWHSTIRKLKKIPAEEIQGKLMISYEDLSDGAKEIFLDIACFFNYNHWSDDMTNAVYMWEACGYFPEDGIDELVSMSLIKIKGSTEFFTEDKIRLFWMHDQIIDLGREIVRREGLKDNDQCSRFYYQEEALDMLRRRKKETNNVKAVSVSLISEESHTLLDGLKYLDNLRYLEVDGDDFQLEGILEHVSSNLRWLSCRVAMASEFKLPNQIYLNKLVILDLSDSDITEDWDGWKKIKGLCSLKVLDLSFCSRLRRTPDLTQCTSLERLILHGCVELVEIDRSIGNLKALKFLNLGDCGSLKSLPEEVCCLVHLEVLHKEEQLAFTTDGGIQYLPESIGSLKSLSKLELRDVSISRLPESIGQLVKLETFVLIQNRYCHPGIRNIPKEVGNLTSLVTLRLENLGIASLPDSVGGLVNLKSLSLISCSKLKSLPDSLGRLVKLEELLLSGCSQLIGLPDSVGNMRLLKRIDVTYCIELKKLPRFTATQKQLQVIKASHTALEGVPTEIELLTGLTHLYFQWSRICGLPSIAHLCHLEELHLEGCHNIKQFPELPTSLIRLYTISQSSFPDLSNLLSLEIVHLKLGKRKLPKRKLGKRCFLWELECDLCYFDKSTHRQSLNIEWIGRLSKLTELALQCWRLSLQSPPLLLLPYGFTKLYLLVVKGMASLDLTPLKSLTELTVIQCNDLVEILGLQKLYSLERLKIIKCNALEKLDDLSELNRLEFLLVGECKKLTVIIGIHQLQSLTVIVIYTCHSLGRFVGSSRFKNVVNGIRDQYWWSVRMKYCNMLSDLTGLEVVFKYIRELNVEGCRSLKSLFDLSALRRLSWLKIINCRKLQEIQGLEGLESLVGLEVSGCRSLERLNIVNCNKLEKIQGLGELTSLETLRISGCDSIETLSFDPWMFQKLKKAHIENCKNLKDIIGLDNLQLLPECLLIYRCQLLGCRLLDGLKMQHDTVEHPVTVSKVELLQNKEDSDYYLGDLFKSEHEGTEADRDAYWCLPIGSVLSNFWHSLFR